MKHNRPKLMHVVLIALSVLSISLCVSTVFFYREYKSYQSIWKHNLANTDEWTARCLKAESHLEFYYDHVALIVNDGTLKYHTLDCETLLDTSSDKVYIFTVQKAEQDGFYACPTCH